MRAPGVASLPSLLFSQGFGTRRECRALVLSGRVRVGGLPHDEPDVLLAAAPQEIEVDGVRWPVRERALVMLNKPAGYECSTKPRHHPSVLSLLPPPLRTRGVQPVGRLDEDTTGLLLLTDDGALIHRLTSPKHHVAKVYEVGTRHAISQTQVQALRDGVVLDDDPAPVRAAAAERVGDQALRLTLTEGRYHQVKRMVAAVGNRVETLHRSRFGDWTLPPDLPAGGWCWLDAPAAASKA
jgi:16S rRNA pseudouridine516 synthase